MKNTLGSLYQRKKKRPDGTVQVLPNWWVKYRRNAQVFRESSGETDPDKAMEFLARRVGEIATGKFAGLAVERVTVGDLIRDVEQDYIVNDRKELPILKLRIKTHLMRRFGKIRAADFGTANVKAYIAARKRAGAANATINRELAVVRRAFNLAFEHDPPKVARVPHISSLQENNVRTGFLEHAEYLKLRDALPEELKLLLVIGYHTGVRRGELINIRWNQVDLRARRIRLEVGTTKNKEGRHLPIYGEMGEWLDMARSIAMEKFPKCPWLFHRDGKRILDIRKGWDTARVAAGVPDILLHDLRRAAARNMVRAGIPEKIVMMITGHKTRAMLDRYNIVNDRDLDLAAARMDAHLGTLLGTPATPEAKSEGKEKTVSPLN
jgi:integrase